MSMLSRPAGSPGSVDAAIGRTLGSLFNASTTRHVLELSSPVSGDIVARAAKDAQVSLRTVDFNSNWRNAQGDSKSDILVAIDLVNHAPWSTTEALFAHVDDVLDQSAHATLVISSPVKIGGFFRSATDEELDRDLRRRNKDAGVRDLEDLRSLGVKAKLDLVERHVLPRGHWLLYFRRQVESDKDDRGVSPSDFTHSIPSEQYPAEAGRYHLYAGYYCPFASRALVVRELKGLTGVISLSILHWDKGETDPDTGDQPGWRFATDAEFAGCIPDPVYGAKYLSEIYFRSDPAYRGRYSVPVLFDKKTGTIVSNDSLQILRMLSTAFDDVGPADRRGFTYAPAALLSLIETESPKMQDKLNRGVYMAGWADSQTEYEERCREVFKALDRYEAMLAESDGSFLLGKRLTELDIQLYTTIVRFDPVYNTFFKLNLKRIRDGYPQLHLWLRRLYHRVPAFQRTTEFTHIKTNYFASHPAVNPSRIVPLGPLPHIEDLPVEEREAGGLPGSEGTRVDAVGGCAGDGRSKF